MTVLLEAARTYAARGWLVAPLHTIKDGHCTCALGPDCQSPAKHPRTKHGLTEASADVATIETWWKRWPDANVAIVTGAGSGLVVLDVDGYHGGDDTLAALEAEHGPLPATLQVITGGDGMHLLFVHPGEEIRNTAGKKLGQGLDVRGDGGYVVAAPSLHLSGRRYEWVDAETSPAPMPAWMLERLRKPAPVAPPAPATVPRADSGGTPYGLEALARELADVRSTGQGGRNHQLNESAFVLGQLVAGGELEEALVVTELAAAGMAIGLGEVEVIKTIASGMAGGKEKPRTAPARPDRPAGSRRAWEPPPGDDDAPPPDDAFAIADELLAGAPPAQEPPEDDEGPPGPGGYRQSDRGNARRLVDAHGQDLRYCPSFGQWLAWDGKRWARDLTGEVYRRAKRTIEGILAELPRLPADERKHLFRFVLSSEGQGRIESMVRCAQTEAGMPVAAEDLDADPWSLNVANGTVDLRTGALRAHRRADHITKLAPVDYDPEAAAPLFQAFLTRIMGDDEDLAAFVQRAVGYALTGACSEDVLFFFYGAGANGKTTLVTVLQRLLGEYSKSTERDLLIASRGEKHPTGVADLFGVRMAVAEEVDEGQRFDEGLVKQLTGGGRVRARFMRQDFFEFEPSHTLFVVGNHKPVVRGTGKAIWRRIRLVPFEVSIPEAEWDTELDQKLLAEGPGILAWAVRGCLAWQREGLGWPARVREATEGYRRDNDVLGDFLDECCDVDADYAVDSGTLYDAYTRWAERNKEFVHNRRRFGMHLTERGFLREQVGRQKIWTWRGLRARPFAAHGSEQVEHRGLDFSEPDDGPRLQIRLLTSLLRRSSRDGSWSSPQGRGLARKSSSGRRDRRAARQREAADAAPGRRTSGGGGRRGAAGPP